MIEVVVPFETRRNRTRRAKAEGPRLYPARVARQLALAHALQARVTTAEFRDYADMARALGFTRARITQLMNLLVLAPDIQEQILFLEFPPAVQPISERYLRVVVKAVPWGEQRALWARVRAKAAATAAVVAP